MLPSGGFKVDLEVEHLDDNIYRHLLYIRHFLWSLRSKSPHPNDLPEAEPPKVNARSPDHSRGNAPGSLERAVAGHFFYGS